MQLTPLDLEERHFIAKGPHLSSTSKPKPLLRARLNLQPTTVDSPQNLVVQTVQRIIAQLDPKKKSTLWNTSSHYVAQSRTIESVPQAIQSKFEQERKAMVPVICHSLMANIAGVSGIAGTYLDKQPLEGATPSSLYPYLQEVLEDCEDCPLKKKLARGLAQLMDMVAFLNAVEKVEDGESLTAQFIRNRIKCLQPHQSLLLPSGWRSTTVSHAILLEVICEGKDRFALSIYNSGDGLGEHPEVEVARGDGLGTKSRHLQRLTYSGLSFENITAGTSWKIYHRLCAGENEDIPFTAKTFYQNFLKSFDSDFLEKALTQSQDDAEIRRDQVIGNCLIDVFLAYAKSHSKKFKRLDFYQLMKGKIRIGMLSRYYDFLKKEGTFLPPSQPLSVKNNKEVHHYGVLQFLERCTHKIAKDFHKALISNEAYPKEAFALLEIINGAIVSAQKKIKEWVERPVAYDHLSLQGDVVKVITSTSNLNYANEDLNIAESAEEAYLTPSKEGDSKSKAEKPLSLLLKGWPKTGEEFLPFLQQLVVRINQIASFEKSSVIDDASLICDLEELLLAMPGCSSSIWERAHSIGCMLQIVRLTDSFLKLYVRGSLHIHFSSSFITPCKVITCLLKLLAIQLKLSRSVPDNPFVLPIDFSFLPIQFEKQLGQERTLSYFFAEEGRIHFDLAEAIKYIRDYYTSGPYPSGERALFKENCMLLTRETMNALHGLPVETFRDWHKNEFWYTYYLLRYKQGASYQFDDVARAFLDYTGKDLPVEFCALKEQVCLTRLYFTHSPHTTWKPISGNVLQGSVVKDGDNVVVRRFSENWSFYSGNQSIIKTLLKSYSQLSPPSDLRYEDNSAYLLLQLDPPKTHNQVMLEDLSSHKFPEKSRTWLHYLCKEAPRQQVMQIFDSCWKNPGLLKDPGFQLIFQSVFFQPETLVDLLTEAPEYAKQLKLQLIRLCQDETGVSLQARLFLFRVNEHLNVLLNKIGSEQDRKLRKEHCLTSSASIDILSEAPKLWALFKGKPKERGWIANELIAAYGRGAKIQDKASLSLLLQCILWVQENPVDLELFSNPFIIQSQTKRGLMLILRNIKEYSPEIFWEGMREYLGYSQTVKPEYLRQGKGFDGYEFAVEGKAYQFQWKGVQWFQVDASGHGRKQVQSVPPYYSCHSLFRTLFFNQDEIEKIEVTLKECHFTYKKTEFRLSLYKDLSLRVDAYLIDPTSASGEKSWYTYNPASDLEYLFWTKINPSAGSPHLLVGEGPFLPAKIRQCRNHQGMTFQVNEKGRIDENLVLIHPKQGQNFVNWLTNIDPFVSFWGSKQSGKISFIELPFFHLYLKLDPVGFYYEEGETKWYLEFRGLFSLRKLENYLLFRNEEGRRRALIPTQGKGFQQDYGASFDRRAREFSIYEVNDAGELSSTKLQDRLALAHLYLESREYALADHLLFTSFEASKLREHTCDELFALLEIMAGNSQINDNEQVASPRDRSFEASLLRIQAYHLLKSNREIFGNSLTAKHELINKRIRLYEIRDYCSDVNICKQRASSLSKKHFSILKAYFASESFEIVKQSGLASKPLFFPHSWFATIASTVFKKVDLKAVSEMPSAKKALSCGFQDFSLARKIPKELFLIQFPFFYQIAAEGSLSLKKELLRYLAWIEEPRDILPLVAILEVRALTEANEKRGEEGEGWPDTATVRSAFEIRNEKYDQAALYSCLPKLIEQMRRRKRVWPQPSQIIIKGEPSWFASKNVVETSRLDMSHVRKEWQVAREKDIKLIEEAQNHLCSLVKERFSGVNSAPLFLRRKLEDFNSRAEKAKLVSRVSAHVRQGIIKSVKKWISSDKIEKSMISPEPIPVDAIKLLRSGIETEFKRLRSKATLGLLEERILKLANRSHDPRDSRLLQQASNRLAKREQPFTLSELFHLYLVKDSTRCFQRNSALTLPDQAELVKQIEGYLLRATWEQQLERALKRLDEIEFIIKHCGQPNGDCYKALRDILGAKLAYSPDLHPECLVFEYLANVRLRQEQIKALDELLDGTESCVKQMIMGSGKSDILLPLLALRNADRANLSILMFPQTLIDSMVDGLQRRSGAVLGQVVKRFNWRGKSGKGLTLSELKARYQDLLQIQDQRELLVMSDRDKHEFDLQLLDALLIYQNTLTSEAFEKLQAFQAIDDLFRKWADVLIDEVDSCLRTNFEARKALGRPELIDPLYGQVTTLAYEILLTDREFTRDLIFDCSISEQEEKGRAEAVLFDPTLHWDRVRSVLQTKLLARLEMVYDFSSIRAHHSTVHRYLQGDAHELPASLPLRIKNALAVLKLQLHTVLPNALKNIHGERYGRTKVGLNESLLAIPHQQTVPCHDSQFSLLEEMMDYTIQDYVKKGMSAQILGRIMRELQANVQQEMRENFGRPLTETAGYKSFAGIFPDKASSFMLLEECHFSDLAKELNKKENLPRLLEFIRLNILNKIQHYLFEIVSSAQTMTSTFHRVQGISGTIAKEQANFHRNFTRIQPDEIIDGQVILALLKNEQPLQPLPSQGSAIAILDRILKEKGEYQAILDAGALLIGTPPLILAKRVLEKTDPKAIDAVIYYERGEANILKRSHPDYPEPFDSRAPCKHPGRRFTLYDAEHCTGADILQAPYAKGCLTVNQNLSFHELAQAAYRFRKILQGQKIALGIPDQVAHLIQKKLGKSVLDVSDVLLYTLQQQACVQEEHNPKAVRQKMQGALQEMCLSIMHQVFEKEPKEVGSAPMRALTRLIVLHRHDTPYENYKFIGGFAEAEKVLKTYQENILQRVEKWKHEAGSVAETYRSDLLLLRSRLQSIVDCALEKGKETVPEKLPLAMEQVTGQEVATEVQQEQQQEQNVSQEQRIAFVRGAGLKEADYLDWEKVSKGSPFNFYSPHPFMNSFRLTIADKKLQRSKNKICFPKISIANRLGFSPPMMSINDALLSNSEHESVTIQDFFSPHLLGSLNLLFTDEHGGAMGSLQKPIHSCLIVQAWNEHRLILLGDGEIEFFREKFQEPLSVLDQMASARMALVNLSMGYVLQSKCPLQVEAVPYELILQAKFLAGITHYPEHEIAELRNWFTNESARAIGLEAIRKFFVNTLLSKEEGAFGAYLTSPLAKLFDELR